MISRLCSAATSISHLLSEEDLCFVIKQEIGPLIKDSDFESMYKDGGRPPVSPRMLTLVLLISIYLYRIVSN
jgi:hypothetical protein